MNKERFSESRPAEALDATTTISTDTTTYGAWIDTLGARSLTIPLDITRTTDGQIDSIGFQGANLATYADAADLDDAENLYYPGSFPVALTGQIHVGCVAKDRYVRLKIVTSGFTSGSIVMPKTLGLLQDTEVTPEIKTSSVIADANVRSPGQTADTETTHPKR